MNVAMLSSSVPLKRSVTIRGHRTSISMENEFWEALQEIAAAQKCSVSGLIAQIDALRAQPHTTSGLSSAVRVYILGWYRKTPTAFSGRT